MSTDRVEGQYSLQVNTGDDPYDFANYLIGRTGNIDTENDRYFYLWVNSEAGATWFRMPYVEVDDPNRTYEYVTVEDGEIYFRVGQELEANKWNLVIVDTREMNVDGIDKNTSRISIHTNEFSQWKWDNAGVSRKELMTYTGKQQDDSTGLYYFNAWYYDPMLGRFITEDPAKDGGNWYSYCGNNPLAYVDRT